MNNAESHFCAQEQESFVICLKMFSLFLCLCNLFLLLLKMAPSNFIEVKKGNRSRNRPPIKASLPPPFLDFPASQWHHVFPILTKKLANLRRQCTHFFVGCMKVILKLRVSSLLKIVLSYESLPKSHYDRSSECLLQGCIHRDDRCDRGRT